MVFASAKLGWFVEKGVALFMYNPVALAIATASFLCQFE
jgi:hypothetical protein